MKFLFEYRTSDNALKKGVVSATTRDAAYAQLKARGIRPSRVVEAPGFFNKFLGKGKRWSVIFTLSLILVAAIISNEKLRREIPSDCEDRSHLYGDPAVIQRCEQQQWTNVFADAGDCVLAMFARPGASVAIPAEKDAWINRVAQAIDNSKNVKVSVSVDESPEVAKMKRIVNGMKRELSEYIADGGTARLYVERLVERQGAEVVVLENFKRDFEKMRKQGEELEDRRSIIERWDEKNTVLRRMGLPSRAIPTSWE